MPNSVVRSIIGNLSTDTKGSAFVSALDKALSPERIANYKPEEKDQVEKKKK